MKRTLIALSALTLLFAWTLSTPTRALPPSGSTTTRVLLPAFGQIDWATYTQGSLDATFVATPVAGGGWFVQASFKPVDLSVVGDIDANVSGKATGSLPVALGTTGSFFATRLNMSGGNGRLYVLASIVVDAAGAVSVEGSWLGILHEGDGPCTDC